MIKDKLYSTYLDAICDKVAERTVELSGIPPLSFTANGKPLTAWTITGNTVQNGTPTPDNPVEVFGCGDYDSDTGMYKIPVVTRGKNLAGNYTVSSGYYYDDSGTPTPSDARFIRLIINVEPNTIYTISSNLKFYSIWEFNNNTKISRRGGDNSNKYTIKTTKECNSLRISMSNTSGEADTSAFEWIQLEKGSTATPYEPYHEPITTPIYLPTPLYSGEVMRSDGSRDVKFGKLVLTGSEDWKLQSINSYGIANFYIKVDPTFKPGIKHFCTHFSIQTTLIAQTTNEGLLFTNNDTIYIRVKQELANTVSSLKSWLTEQYTAGTPVTIWYTLETLTTEAFTAPQIPTLNGTTVIDVNTAVKPTEMYTKYKSSK